MSLNCFSNCAIIGFLEQVGHIIDLSAESGLQIVHQFAEHRFQGFQQHGNSATAAMQNTYCHTRFM